jgi:hypothetical protein
LELLGITDEAVAARACSAGGDTRSAGDPVERVANPEARPGVDHWDAAERQTLKDNMAAHRPFLDLLMHRRCADGSQQRFRVSGEPIFDRTCRVTGYRGLGVEVLDYR